MELGFHSVSSPFIVVYPRQERRLAKLRGERKTLLEAHYANAIPLARPFEPLLGEDLRKHVARCDQADVVDAVGDVSRTGGDEMTPEPGLALTGATRATAHAVQSLKEKTMVALIGQLSNPDLGYQGRRC